MLAITGAAAAAAVARTSARQVTSPAKGVARQAGALTLSLTTEELLESRMTELMVVCRPQHPHAASSVLHGNISALFLSRLREGLSGPEEARKAQRVCSLSCFVFLFPPDASLARTAIWPGVRFCDGCGCRWSGGVDDAGCGSHGPVHVRILILVRSFPPPSPAMSPTAAAPDSRTQRPALHVCAGMLPRH